MFKLVLILSSFCVPNILCIIVDYCNPRLCPPPQFKTHTGCHNHGVRFRTHPEFTIHKIAILFQRFSSACPPDIKVERMNLTQKQQMLDLHNYYRMQVALGNTETYITVCLRLKLESFVKGKSKSSISFVGGHRKFPDGHENDEIGEF